MKKLYTLAALSLLGSSLAAQTISVEEAQQKAAKFLSKNNPSMFVATRGQSPLKLAYTSAQGDETYYHVFNYGQNGGFIIIGGDEAAQEVLGYSENGSFDINSIPSNLKAWLNGYDQQISYAIREVKAGRMTINKSKTATRAITKTNIEPLLNGIQWNQDDPYNSEIPTLGPGYTGNYAFATGCVATAGAQVMKYYNYPEKGYGTSDSYQIDYGVTILTFSADYANTTYDWSNMCNKYVGGETDVQKKAVGTLMYHIGVACGMSYGQIGNGGSSASSEKLATAMVKKFGYDKSMSYEYRTSYNDNDWEDLIYNELSNNRPVIYSGRTPNDEGHAFICEGYKDGVFYINWGWGGSSDGYYSLNGTLNPPAMGIGGGSAGFTLEHAAIIGIKPDEGSLTRISFQAAEFSLSAAMAASCSSVLIHGVQVGASSYKSYMYSTSSDVVNTSYGVRLNNASDSYDIVIGTGAFSNHNGPFYDNFTIPANIPVGTYSVAPIFKNENGEWQTAAGLPSTLPTLTVTAPTGIVFEEPIKISNDGNVLLDKFTISFKLKNASTSTYTEPLKIVLWGPDNRSILYLEATDIEAGASKSYLITESNCSDFYNYMNQPGNGVGSYTFSVQNNTLREYYYFNVTAPLNISYEMTDAEWGTICLPYDAEIPSGLTAYTITAVSGSAIVKTEVTSLAKNTPYLLNGAAGTYNFTGPNMTATGTFTEGLLTGTTATGQFAPVNSYVLQNLPSKNGVAFYKVQNRAELTLDPYHAFLRVPAGSAGMASFTLGTAESTGIEDIESAAQDGIAYDIFGNRVDASAKGIVIKNGAKYIIK